MSPRKTIIESETTMTSYIASYDISHDGMRTRVSRVLCRFGTRLQKSVFLIWMDDADIEELKREIGPLLARTDDFDLIPIDLNPHRNWLRWQRDIEFAQPVRVFS